MLNLTESMSQPNTVLSPPDDFRGAGDVHWAHLTEEPGFVRRGSRRGAKGRGIRYEERTQRALDRQYGNMYVASPWVCFSADGSGPRYCQPDGLLVDIERGKIFVVEIKYNHVAMAYWKLFHLYKPVVQKLFGDEWRYSCVEVVKWYDASTYGPADVTLRRRVHEAAPREWAVVIINER